MQRIFGFVPLLALCYLCLCSPVAAETVDARVLPPMYYETGRPIFSQVAYTNVGYNSGGPSCGADAGCSTGAQCCDHVPNCLDGIWNNYCGSKRGCRLKPCGMSFMRHGCGSGCNTGCNSCSTGSSCNSCGSTGDCGCAGNRWGFQGCLACCKPCHRPHCGPIRCWANGWCGETLDGFASGNPPCAPTAPCSSCNNGSQPYYQPEQVMPMQPMSPAPAPPANAPAPAPAPEKAARRSIFAPVSTPRFAPGYGIK